MYFKNTTIEEMQKALDIINKKYDNNIKFNRLEKLSKNRIAATLKVKDTHKIGSKINQQYLINKQNSESNKGIIAHNGSACWHVHGDFFDALFDLNRNAIVTSLGKKITYYNGNWEDRNIGSLFYPLYYSEACDCE